MPSPDEPAQRTSRRRFAILDECRVQDYAVRDLVVRRLDGDTKPEDDTSWDSVFLGQRFEILRETS